jgi:hypothetical protein
MIPAKPRRRARRPAKRWKFCRQGHRLTPKNVITSGTHRKCRICWDDYFVAFKLGWRQGAHRKPVKTCKRGHKFSEANTRLKADGTRICRKCMARLCRYYRHKRKKRDRKLCPRGHPLIPGNVYRYKDGWRCCECQRNHNATHNKKFGIVRKTKPPRNEQERWERILKDFGLGMGVGEYNLSYGEVPVAVAEQEAIWKRFAKGHKRKRCV